MKKIICLSLLLCFLPILLAQDLPDDLQIGNHSVKEWKYIVDTTWGEGMQPADKLILFDRFWEAVDKHYAGFVNNSINWDSVKNHYRPEIENGVSHGRFAGIINRMGLILMESHCGAYNSEVYLTTPGRDVPMLIAGHYSNPDSTILLNNGWFGATLTPLNNDHLLVLRSVANHPLGLQAGDIVLGYDGVPWKDIYPLLLQMEFTYTTNTSFQFGQGILHGDFVGSSDESSEHKWLAAAGMNWHLFDTLDIQKYGSEDTIHLSTKPLEGKELFIAGNEQIQLEGIEFPGALLYEEYPEVEFLPPVIFDTILNNSIGYVYYLHMVSSDNVSKLTDAINSLSKSDIKGIILDLRYNVGGNMGWETGFNSIFNRTIDSCDYYARTIDGDRTDLYKTGFIPFKELSKDFLNKPIALITGAGANSNGDYASYFIHTQPMTRSFGRGSNTGYTMHGAGMNTLENFNNPNLFWDFGYPGWDVQLSSRNFGRYIDGELKYFIHNGFELDEEIWFSQEAALQQKDNMVERAVEWIQSVAYADNCSISPTYPDPDLDSELFILSTGINNPKDHNYDLKVKIFDREGKFIEEVSMQENANKGTFGEDQFDWSGSFESDREGFYSAEFSTYDITEDSWLTYPEQFIFTSVKMPELFPKVFQAEPNMNNRLYMSLTNISETPLMYAKVKFTSSNPIVDIKLEELNYGNLLENEKTKELMQVVNIGSTQENNIWIKADIYSYNELYWRDSILLTFTTDNDDRYLIQDPVLKIYPNPMREFCRIQFSGSEALHKIEVYDLTGRKVFSETGIEAYSYELRKGNLRNGIYILRVYADKLYERKLIVQ